MWLVLFVLLRDAQNKDEAHAFLNYICDLTSMQKSFRNFGTQRQMRLSDPLWILRSFNRLPFTLPRGLLRAANFKKILEAPCSL